MNAIYRLLGTIALAGSLWACSSDDVQQANYQIVPLPNQITITPQASAFNLNNDVKILYPEGNAKMQKNAAFLAQYIKGVTGNEPQIETGSEGDNAIVLSVGMASDNPEAYELTVTAENVSIEGASEAGVFYGIQTLRKSLPLNAGSEVLLPAVKIEDSPQFSYRGMHLDVSRHFNPVDSIKKFIDMLALHNMNRLHWHLTDDQGWRIEIKKYPKLTEIGSKRAGTVIIGENADEYKDKPYGGFYTQEDAKEIVAYAADRHITVVPEIDLPGHVQAALAAYPELGCTGGPYEVWKRWGVSDNVLCAGNDASLEFVDGVLGEIVEMFPSEYIHVGGDECPKGQWAKCPKCQARIKDLGLKASDGHTAEEKLQNFVITHAGEFLKSKGRKIIGWDEIMEGGPDKSATIMAWRSVKNGNEAAQKGHDVIMTPSSNLYFDYYQTKETEKEPQAIGGYLPIEAVYNFEPVSESLDSAAQKHIVGVQANIWTEYMPTYSQIEYMALPRMAALSEVQWMQPEKKNYNDFLARVPGLVEQYKAQGYNYAKHLFDVNVLFTPNATEGVLDVTMVAIDGADIHYTLDGTEPSVASAKYTQALKIDKPSHLRAVVVRPTGNSRIFDEKIEFNKASMKPITMLQPINKQYEFEGAITLVDGLRGNGNYRTGRWIAFYQGDMEAVIDLVEMTEISKAQIQTCVAQGDWVLDVRSFSVAVSQDGKTYNEVASAEYPAMIEGSKNGVYVHELSFDPIKTRYVKIIAKPEHSMPSWHGGKGKAAFMFIDDISLN